MTEYNSTENSQKELSSISDKPSLSPVDQILLNYGFLNIHKAKGDDQWVMGSSIVLHAAEDGVMVMMSIIPPYPILVVPNLNDLAEFTTHLDTFIQKISQE